MKNSEYWKKRFEQLEQLSNDTATKYNKEAEKSFNRAIAKIESDIEKWYNRLAVNNEVSLIRAKELLNSKELKEFRWTVEEYINYGEINSITQEWLKELENASAKVHIERLEAIKLQMQNQIEIAYGNLEDGLSTTLGTIYKDFFYRTAYEIQKGLNVGSSMALIDEDKIQKAIRKPWGADSKNFSTRLWGNKQKLINTLNTNLTQSIIRGEDPSKAIKQITKVLGTAKSNVSRLVMTESAFISSAAQKNCFSELNVEKYEIIATLDTHTSSICRELDGKVFDMKDYQPGVTAPPFHPYCRTTTCPYFNDEFTTGEERAYRDADGKTQYVKDMKYDEWYKQYVVKPLKNDIIKTDKQFGKKIGKHTREYGLDPSNQNDREKMKEIIDDILVNHDEIAQGNWRGQDGTVDFYIKGEDVVVVNGNMFVTILKGGVNNARVKNTRKRKV